MKTIEISSAENATFKGFLNLSRSREIKKQQKAILSGHRSIREVLNEFPDQCAGIIYTESLSLPDTSLMDRFPCYRLSPELFQQVDSFGTRHPLLLVRAAPFEPVQSGHDLAGCTLCIPFQDPANVGATIRAAAAFGVSRVLVLREAAHPFHPKSLRAAGSNVFRVPICQGPSLYDLYEIQTDMVVMKPQGKDIARFHFPNSFWLVPGLEGPGLPENITDKDHISIPMAEGVESLNAAMATGIVLYAWHHSKGKTG